MSQTAPPPDTALPPSTDPVPVTNLQKHVPTIELRRPTISFPDQGRRPSVQFNTHGSEAVLRTASPVPSKSSKSSRLGRRLSSPPPPSTYENRVSFDTFDNKDAPDFSFTLKAKHKGYAYSKRSRTFMCGTDQNDYSEFALEWLLDELVDDGDEVVCLRVVDKDHKMNSDSSLEQQRYRLEAHKLMQHIQSKTKDEGKTISLILEFATGKIQETIQRMIAIYEPSCLVVGTRGRSLGGIQGLLPGSVSKYCLQNSPVPVIVVRPSSKREKKKQKRRADPSRRSYVNILEKSEASGSQVLTNIENDPSSGPTTIDAEEREAAAVAKAIGISSDMAGLRSFRRPVEEKETVDAATLTKATSNRSDQTSGPDSPSPTEELRLEDGMTEVHSPGSQASDADDEETAITRSTTLKGLGIAKS